MARGHAESAGAVFVAYAGSVDPAAALGDSQLYIPTDIQSFRLLFGVNKVPLLGEDEVSERGVTRGHDVRRVFFSASKPSSLNNPSSSSSRWRRTVAPSVHLVLCLCFE